MNEEALRHYDWQAFIARWREGWGSMEVSAYELLDVFNDDSRAAAVLLGEGTVRVRASRLGAAIKKRLRVNFRGFTIMVAPTPIGRSRTTGTRRYLCLPIVEAIEMIEGDRPFDWPGLIARWVEHFGTDRIAVKQLVKLCDNQGIKLDVSSDPVHSLGIAMRSQVGRIAGGYQVVDAGKIGGSRHYRLIATPKPDAVNGAETWAALVALWLGKFGWSAEILAGTLMREAGIPDTRANTTAFGMAMRHQVGNVYHGYRIEIGGKYAGMRKYRLVKATEERI